MYIDTSTRNGAKGQVYTRYLLRSSFRENGKVKHKTIANLSHCSAEEIVAIKLALKNKKDLNQLGSLDKDVDVQQGESFGATYLLDKIAQRIGVKGALGSSQEAKLALWQVLTRIMGQGSRLSSVRLAKRHCAPAIIGMTGFNEDHLYANLDWINSKQHEVEDKLFKFRHKEKTEFFLYDITSSYLEGTQNELANWGYNRDKKNGKMQIVVGLLCDEQGLPVAIEVFDGSTSDCTTVGRQMEKIAKRWHCKSVTLIGDKGMIQGPQIKDLEKRGQTFITTIRKSSIEPLLAKAGYQMSLLDEDLLEVIDDGYRYILRKNPVQAQKTAETRRKLIEALESFLCSQNCFLEKHGKAKIENAKKRVEQRIKKFKLSYAITVSEDTESRNLSLEIDEQALIENKKLDGCYAMKTNLNQEDFSKQEIHDKYKGLALVEDAFRCSKTELLEMRPIHVRLEGRTRGHVFTVMLAYLLVKELESCWKSLNYTTEECIDILKSFQTVDLKVKGKIVARKVPLPNKITQTLFRLAEVDIPESIPMSKEIVDTRKKIGKDRK